MSKKYFKSNKHIENAKNAAKKGHESIQAQTKLRIEEYYKNPKLCLACEQAIDYKKKNSNLYCNSKCRAIKILPTRGRSRTNEEKEKISIALSGRTLSEEHIANIKLNPNTNCNFHLLNSEQQKERSLKISESLKKHYDNNPDAKIKLSEFRKTCTASPETKEKLRAAMKKRIEDGTHKGWAKRNNPSYPEMFFMEVLKNNDIKFEFEKKVGKYFIDFALNEKMIALEIDGKQHMFIERIQKDSEKDEFLANEKWKVYRIKWREINSEAGKEYIKKEIQKFVEFYNSIKT